MRKIIDIPDDLKIELQVLAARSGLDLKNYIQNLLKKHIEDHNKMVMSVQPVIRGNKTT